MPDNHWYHGHDHDHKHHHHHHHHKGKHSTEREIVPSPASLNIIEAVTICVGYDDFLEEAIKRNQGLFDRWIIVTSPDDEPTRDLCRKYSLQALLTEDHTYGAEFNKGRMIERGLQHLSKEGWRVHIDGDILLPNNFRNIIKSSRLDPKKIYGADRIMVRSRQEWEALQKSGWMSNDYHCRVNPPEGFRTGTRWAHHNEGYVPIGYFQMWHSSEDIWKGARVKPYPNNHNDACRTDVQFALQWDRKHREVIPELIVVHLESGPAPMGANWNGRKTKKF